jgi:hypothetical protein
VLVVESVVSKVIGDSRVGGGGGGYICKKNHDVLLDPSSIFLSFSPFLSIFFSFLLSCLVGARGPFPRPRGVRR